MSRVRGIIITFLFLALVQGFCYAEEYVEAGIVREMLDCDGKYTNDQKRLLLSDFRGSRTVFRDQILTIHASQNQIALMGSFFQGIPKVKPASREIYKSIVEGSEYTFNCVVGSYCADGMIDGDLEFSECMISREDYVILDDVQDAAYWWRRVANVSDASANEMAESLFKNLRDGTMNGLQIGPAEAGYAFEFQWKDGHLLVRKVAN